MKALSVPIVSELRRANSSCTARFMCEPLTGPRTLMMSASANDTPRAIIDRGKNGLRAPNRQTRPNAPANTSVQPRARLWNESFAFGACVANTADTTIPAMASIARPPAHQPTTAQAASAGTNSSIVSSTGSSARNCGTLGKNRNAANPSNNFPQPRSPAGATDTTAVSTVAVLVVGSVTAGQVAGCGTGAPGSGLP